MHGAGIGIYQVGVRKRIASLCRLSSVLSAMPAMCGHVPALSACLFWNSFWRMASPILRSERVIPLARCSEEDMMSELTAIYKWVQKDLSSLNNSFVSAWEGSCKRPVNLDRKGKHVLLLSELFHAPAEDSAGCRQVSYCCTAKLRRGSIPRDMMMIQG